MVSNRSTHSSFSSLRATSMAFIAAGSNHTVALLEDRTVRCWGSNVYGQYNVPSNIGVVTSVAAGAFHTVALLEDGTVRCWGWNDEGQLDVPSDLGVVTSVAAGDQHIVVVLEDGTVRCWGDISYVPDDIGHVGPCAPLTKSAVRLVGQPLTKSAVRQS